MPNAWTTVFVIFRCSFKEAVPLLSLYSKNLKLFQSLLASTSISLLDTSKTIESRCFSIKVFHSQGMFFGDFNKKFGIRLMLLNNLTSCSSVMRKNLLFLCLFSCHDLVACERSKQDLHYWTKWRICDWFSFSNWKINL